MKILSHCPSIRVAFKGWSDSPALPCRYVASCDRHGIRPEVLCAHGQTAMEAQQEVAQKLLDRINAKFDSELSIFEACSYNQVVYFALK